MWHYRSHGVGAESCSDEPEALLGKLAQKDETIRVKQLKIDQLTHEMAILKRWRFGRRSEQIESGQRSLLEESIDEAIEAISVELEALQKPAADRPAKQKPRRVALPGHLPRREFRHEPEQTVCSCGCSLERIGEDVSAKLGYIPGLFEVERHIRGKWVCRRCERLIQAPVPPQVIDKGLPTASLLAQVLVAKFADHQPLYRQEGIFERAGLAIPRSRLAEWSGTSGVRLEPLWWAQKDHLLRRTVVHADEIPVPMLKPGLGHTHRAYLGSYGTTEYDPAPIVVYEFAESRRGQHARTFLGDWAGMLVCDDYIGYKALFEKGVIEAGCMAHARRKFDELYSNHRSELAAEALELFGKLYQVEREAREQNLDAIGRARLRQERARPIADLLHEWLIAHRLKVPDGSASAKPIDYSRKLIRYIDDGNLPIDNNWMENRIRPVLGRSNGRFAGSLRAGKRAAVIMSMMQSAKLNGHDPYGYLADVLERLPTQPARQLDELLPHHWQPRR